MNDAVKTQNPAGTTPPDLSKRQMLTRGGIVTNELINQLREREGV